MSMTEDGTRGKSELEWGTERVTKVRTLVAQMNGQLAKAWLREDEAAIMRLATYYASRILSVSVVETAHAPGEPK